MATRRVCFTVTPKDGTRAFLIDVGMESVRLVNGVGCIDLKTGVEHFLVWRFVGDPGGKLAIVGKVGSTTVVEVKQSTIPPTRTQGAGAKPFKV